MRMLALVIAFVTGLTAPGYAQQAEIEAVNTRWIDFSTRVISPASGRSTRKTPLHSHRVRPW